MKETDFVGTATKVEIRDKTKKTVLQEYECIIYGDVNGDGEITASDYVLIKNHIMETKMINNKTFREVADVNSDKEITASDYVLIKNHIMDIKKLEFK